MLTTRGALPDFLIIGAQKAGTTYLYNNLLRQSLIYGALKEEGVIAKEVRFFSVGKAEGGKRAYRKYFPPRRDLPEGALVGDKSPDYLPTVGAGKQAASIVPGAKVIVLLRNPVDRTYSQYQHAKLMVKQEPLDFEDALEAEPERVLPMYGYLNWSRYIEHLPQWCERFETLVLKSEDLYEFPQAIIREACDFLGVRYEDVAAPAKDARRDKHANKYKEAMDPQTRKSLEQYFEPYNQRLYEYLGRDFGW